MADDTPGAPHEPDDASGQPPWGPAQPNPPVPTGVPGYAQTPPPSPPPGPWSAPAQPQTPAWGSPFTPQPQPQQQPQPQTPQPPPQPQPQQPQPQHPAWQPPPAAGYPPAPPPWQYGAPPTPPARPFGLTPRFVALIVAAGLLVGVAVALPISLLTRNTGSGSAGNNRTGGGSAPATPSAPANGPAAQQARAAYQQALSATRASKGVHYVAVTSGAATQHTTGDAGQDDGTQDITVTSSYGAEQFSLVLLNGVVYFKGNAPAAEDQLGVAPSDAPSVAGKWVTVVRGDGPYTVLQPGITTADQAAEMPLVASTVEKTSAGGKQVMRIRGSVPATADVPAGTATLDVDPGSHLPVTYTSTITAGSLRVTSTTTFSNWGSAPSPTAPSGSVAWSTLNTAEPPGGYGSGGGGNGTPAPA